MDPLVDIVRRVLEHRPEQLAAAWVFGSRAQGAARPQSDLDLAILYARDPPRTLLALPLDLKDEVERAVRVPVDVVVLDHAEVDLVRRVLRDGVLVLDRDRSRRIAFEVRRRAEWFDLAPYLRRYRRASGP